MCMAANHTVRFNEVESIFVLRSANERYNRAPLLVERDAYLGSLKENGTSLMRIKVVSAALLQVVRLLRLESQRTVLPEEIESAGNQWAQNANLHMSGRVGKTSRQTFVAVARRFLRFHRLLDEEALPLPFFDKEFEDHLAVIKVNRGLAVSTLTGYRMRTRAFLIWLAGRRTSLGATTVADLDDYLTSRRSTCCHRTTLVDCVALKSFFEHAAGKGWCNPNLKRCLRAPSVARSEQSFEGPSWTDVRRLLDTERGTKTSDHRAHAILLFCAIYGLRSSEVCRLRLDDFDWIGRTFRLTRSKNGQVQQFPIQYEVGAATLTYLKNGRPHCACRNLFVSLAPPYRSVSPGMIPQMIDKRMRRLGVQSVRRGSHALRHACATQLLRTGSTLREIADFLGHKDLKTVSVYAKHDTASLIEVATFSLRGVL